MSNDEDKNDKAKDTSITFPNTGNRIVTKKRPPVAIEVLTEQKIQPKFFPNLETRNWKPGTDMYTTSRYASKETVRLAQKMASQKKERFLNRNKKTIQEMTEIARTNGDEHIHIIMEKKGKPATISEIQVNERTGWKWEKTKQRCEK